MTSLHFQQTATVALAIQLEYSPIGGDLYVYRLKSGIVTPQGDDSPGPGISALVNGPAESQGFAQLSAIEAFTQGLVGKLAPASGLWLLHPDVIEDARLLGFQQALEKGAVNYGTHMGQVARPFDVLQQNPELVANVVLVVYSDHMLFRVSDGVPLPIAMRLGDGSINNGKYVLETALSILAADTRVVIKSEPGISEIPYCSRDEERTHEISIVFSPTQDDTIALWEKQKSYGTVYPSTTRFDALADLDLLGLRAGGAERATKN